LTTAVLAAAAGFPSWLDGVQPTSPPTATSANAPAIRFLIR
jgi:hypothetical protein